MTNVTGASGERPPWLVRIRPRLDSDPLGAGMLCPDGHVLTCAHVVSKSTDTAKPTEPVYIEFQYAAAHQPIPAIVVDNGWHPERADDSTADVAVLKLQGEPPGGARPAPLRSTGRGIRDHSFYTYGYPRGHAGKGGVPSEGRVVDFARREWIQLVARGDFGHSLQEGFSGSPVWDTDLRGVIGIVVGKGDKGEARTGYAISCDVLTHYWPPLKAFLDLKDAADDEADVRRLEKLLDVGLTSDGGLPKVSDVDIYRIGVSRSKYVTLSNPYPPYAPRRRIDAEVKEALAGTPFLLAVGDSKSGKSRTVLEMLREAMPDARLIVPATDDPTTLAGLTQVALPVGRHRTVIWLDDLDRFLPPNGLDQKVLDHFTKHTPGIVVAATMTSTRYDQMRETSDALNRTARAVLDRAHVIWVPSQLDAEDRTEAQRLYAGEDFSERGIGEQAVAAPAMESTYNASRNNQPEGWAVLQAAIDWRRIGLQLPVPESALRAVFPRYLARVSTELDASERLFMSGLRWARRSVVGTVALLTVAELGSPDRGEDTYRAFDYIVNYADGQGGAAEIPIQEFMWDYAIEAQRDERLLYVAFGALARQMGEVAIRACRAAEDRSDDPQVVARAAQMLGDLELGRGNVDAAVVHLEQALDSGVADVVPLAQTDLGGLLTLRGDDPDRARSLLESALESGGAEVAPLASLNLGVLLMNRGDLAAAQPLLEAALASNDREVTPLANAHISGLLAGQEAAERSRTAQKVMPDRGQGSTQAARAERPAGHGEPDVSRLFRQAVIERRTGLVKLFAQASLGGLLVSQGDLERARVLLDAALHSGNEHVTPLARANLGGLLLQRGDIAGASSEFEAAIEAADPNIAAYARVSLGWVLMQGGFEGADLERGRTLLEEVAESANPDQAARAACLLGDVAIQLGDIDDAAEWYESALRSNHRDWTAYARIGLGIVAAQRGVMDSALEWLQLVADSDHAEEAPRARDLLGDVLTASGDVAGAEQAYGRAIETGHPQWGPTATIDLATLFANSDRGLQAAELLEQVVDSAEEPFSSWALAVLGEVRQNLLLDLDGAREAYERVIACGDPRVAPAAQINMAAMLAESGDEPAARHLLDEASRASNNTIAAQSADILGDLLAEAGETEAAAAAYWRSVERGDPEWSSMARVDLAKLLLTTDEVIPSAEPLLREATNSPIGHIKASSHLLLGLIRLVQGDRAAADSEFGLAAAHGSAKMISETRLQIAKICFEGGDLDRAADLAEGLIQDPTVDPSIASTATAYLGAIRLHQGEVEAAGALLQADSEGVSASLALVHYGESLFERDDIEGAVNLLSAAIEAGDPTVVPQARLALGEARLAQERYDEAADLLQTALDSGRPDLLPRARRYLASARLRQGRHDDARALLLALADSDDSRHRPRGLLLLGQLAGLEHELKEARRWFEAAIATGDPDVMPQAESELAALGVEPRPPAGDGHRMPPPVVPDRPQLESPTVVQDRPQREPPAGPGKPTVEEVPDLPPGILRLLAVLAEAEGVPEEAEYWRHRAANG